MEPYMRNWKVFTNQEKITLETLRLSYKNGSNIVTHAWLNDHSVDFNNSHVNDKWSFYMRGKLESWHTVFTIEVDNNSKP